VTKKKRNEIEAEARGRAYDLPYSLVLLLDDYVAGRGDERRCADALARLTPNQTESVKAYAADRAAEGFEAAEHLAGMLTSLGTTPAAGRARVRPTAES
jgi:hypothetical protein